MDVNHFTQSLAGSVSATPSRASSYPFELEKISCSGPFKIALDPFELLGRHVHFRHHLQAFDDHPSAVYDISATVLAVQVGSSVTGFPTTLVFVQDGFHEHETVPVREIVLESFL